MRDDAPRPSLSDRGETEKDWLLNGIIFTKQLMVVVDRIRKH